MHGVQPMAKIAPSPNDASHPPRVPTMRPPSRSANRASVPERCTRRCEGDGAGRGGQGSRSPGLERPPGPIQGRNPEHAGEIQPEHDQQDPADLAQQRQVVDERPGKVRRGHPEEREDRPEPDDVGDRVPHGQPAGRHALRATDHGHRGELPEVRRDQRQHAW